ncbi:unnamed protein product, partial [Heligmosomoides polygyrus]
DRIFHFLVGDPAPHQEDDEPPLDQKHLNLVHEELEKLNIATDVINKLEVQLDGARACFREIQACWSEKLKELSKKYSSAIAKARPYYEAKIQERKLRDDSQRAAIRFERATSLLAVAKQQVAFTQDSLNRQVAVHPECLEVLNHHIQRVNEAEEERSISGDEHRAISERLMALGDQIRKMEKDQRSSIKKSRTYFDQRLEFTRVLERQKELILRLEAEVRMHIVPWPFHYSESITLEPVCGRFRHMKCSAVLLQNMYLPFSPPCPCRQRPASEVPSREGDESLS